MKYHITFPWCFLLLGERLVSVCECVNVCVCVCVSVCVCVCRYSYIVNLQYSQIPCLWTHLLAEIYLQLQNQYSQYRSSWLCSEQTKLQSPACTCSHLTSNGWPSVSLFQLFCCKQCSFCSLVSARFFAFLCLLLISLFKWPPHRY